MLGRLVRAVKNAVANAAANAAAKIADLAVLGHYNRTGRLATRGEMGIGDVILGIVFAVMMAGVSVLVGGLFFSKTGEVFNKVGINETNMPEWYNLFQMANEYSTTGISIALVSLVLVGIGALLYAVIGYFRR